MRIARSLTTSCSIRGGHASWGGTCMPGGHVWWGYVCYVCASVNTITDACENVTVMGWQESVKVHRRDQSVKDFTSKCLFLLFWLISCVSLIFLIEIWSLCTNLLENYPSHKIDQLPLLRILSLCMDHSMQTRIISLYLFLLFLFTPLALFGQNDVRIHALVWQ